ncbi:MAG: segregation/condensation protein A [Anaerolineae bacterium]|nr:segregation/condensation protein A [Anaerolineae bacterium]
MTPVTEIYRVQLPAFDGPLDLLLSLIEERELDITVIALAAVTDQFLAYVRALDAPEPRLLADFLSLAAKLLLIKSRSLLPPPPLADEEEEAEEDVGEALARQLREYQRFKAAAAGLQAREAANLQVFARDAPTPERPPTPGLDGVTLDDLMAALRRALARLPAEPSAEMPVRPHSVTVESKMVDLRERVRWGRLDFNTWLAEAMTRYEVVAGFLALLELVKERAVVARQDGVFATIWLEAA